LYVFMKNALQTEVYKAFFLNSSLFRTGNVILILIFDYILFQV